MFLIALGVVGVVAVVYICNRAFTVMRIAIHTMNRNTEELVALNGALRITNVEYSIIAFEIRHDRLPSLQELEAVVATGSSHINLIGVGSNGFPKGTWGGEIGYYPDPNKQWFALFSYVRHNGDLQIVAADTMRAMPSRRS
jgi:hypothetical protein